MYDGGLIRVPVFSGDGNVLLGSGFVDIEEGMYGLNKYNFNRGLTSSAWELLSVNLTDMLSWLVEKITLYFDIMMGASDEVLREAHTFKSLEALMFVIIR